MSVVTSLASSSAPAPITDRLRTWLDTPQGRKAFRYTVTSVVSVAVSQATFVGSFVLMGAVSPKMASILATCAGTLPSYYLNRTWAWGRSGRSSLWREVVPFWALSLLSLVFATWSVDFAHTMSAPLGQAMSRSLVVWGAYVASFGVLWVAKFAAFNRLFPSS